jgi:hypothetical protein
MLLRSGVICLISVMSACVLPIAPEFQDPPSAANFSPIILAAMPDVGSVVTAPSISTVPTFTVIVSDPNLGDDLHVRWIADFPPFNANTRSMIADSVITHSSSGVPLNGDDSVTPNCKVHNLAKIPQHQIMAVVADRKFDDSTPDAGTVFDLTKLADADGRKVIATWTLNLDCP